MCFRVEMIVGNGLVKMGGYWPYQIPSGPCHHDPQCQRSLNPIYRLPIRRFVEIQSELLLNIVNLLILLESMVQYGGYTYSNANRV